MLNRQHFSSQQPPKQQHNTKSHLPQQSTPIQKKSNMMQASCMYLNATPSNNSHSNSQFQIHSNSNSISMKNINEINGSSSLKTRPPPDNINYSLQLALKAATAALQKSKITASSTTVHNTANHQQYLPPPPTQHMYIAHPHPHQLKQEQSPKSDLSNQSKSPSTSSSTSTASSSSSANTNFLSGSATSVLFNSQAQGSSKSTNGQHLSVFQPYSKVKQQQLNQMSGAKKVIYRNTLSLMIDNNLTVGGSTCRTSNISLNTNSTNVPLASQATEKLNSSDYDNFESQVTENLNCSLSSDQSSSSSSANENTTTSTSVSKSSRIAAPKPSVKNAFSTMNVSQIGCSKMATAVEKIYSESQHFGSLKRQKRLQIGSCVRRF